MIFCNINLNPLKFGFLSYLPSINLLKVFYASWDLVILLWKPNAAQTTFWSLQGPFCSFKQRGSISINPRREIRNRTEISLQPLHNSQVKSICKCCACQYEILLLFHTVVWEFIFACDRNNSKMFEWAKGEQKDLMPSFGVRTSEGQCCGEFRSYESPQLQATY